LAMANGTPASMGRSADANRCRATDGAYDTRRCHTAILEHNAKAIIPIAKNGRLWREDCPTAAARNRILRDVREKGRAAWKRRRGYHARSRAEAKMRCLKAFGERIAARDPDRQIARSPKSR
jgi:hypothetical protein